MNPFRAPKNSNLPVTPYQNQGNPSPSQNIYGQPANIKIISSGFCGSCEAEGADETWIPIYDDEGKCKFCGVEIEWTAHNFSSMLAESESEQYPGQGVLVSNFDQFNVPRSEITPAVPPIPQPSSGLENLSVLPIQDDDLGQYDLSELPPLPQEVIDSINADPSILDGLQDLPPSVPSAPSLLGHNPNMHGTDSLQDSVGNQELSSGNDNTGYMPGPTPELTDASITPLLAVPGLKDKLQQMQQILIEMKNEQESVISSPKVHHCRQCDQLSYQENVNRNIDKLNRLIATGFPDALESQPQPQPQSQIVSDAFDRMIESTGFALTPQSQPNSQPQAQPQPLPLNQLFKTSGFTPALQSQPNSHPKIQPQPQLLPPSPLSLNPTPASNKSSPTPPTQTRTQSHNITQAQVQTQTSTPLPFQPPNHQKTIPVFLPNTLGWEEAAQQCGFNGLRDFALSQELIANGTGITNEDEKFYRWALAWFREALKDTRAWEIAVKEEFREGFSGWLAN